MSLQVISYNNKTLDGGGGPTGPLTAILPLMINLTNEISLEIDSSLLVKEGKLSVSNIIPALEGNAGKVLQTDGIVMSWGIGESSNSYTKLEIEEFFEGVNPIVGYNRSFWTQAYIHSTQITGNIHGISVGDIAYKSKNNQFMGLNTFLKEVSMITLDLSSLPIDPLANPLVYNIPDYKEGRVFFNTLKKSISLYNSEIGIVQTVSLEGHKHFQLFQPNGLNPFVYTDNAGVLHIEGNIVQNGMAYETHAEQVFTKQDIITLRDGAISGLAAGQYVGFKALKYDGINNGQLVFDLNGIARVGDVGLEQPLCTRIETPGNAQFAFWEASNSRLNFKVLTLSDLPTPLPLIPEIIRGTYRYDSQILGEDTAGDWRTYSNATGYYTQYCTLGGTRTNSTWITKNTIVV